MLTYASQYKYVSALSVSVYVIFA